MEDILSVYERNYDPDMPVVCIDEMTKQHVKETRASVPPAPSRPRRIDYEYERNGVSNIFMHFEPLTGQFNAQVTDRHAKPDWVANMQLLADKEYPDAKKIIVVMDNLATHKASAFYEVLEPSEARRLLDRFEFHYTPKHGSWLNMAEIGLSILSRECLDRRIPDQPTMIDQIKTWQLQKNAQGKAVDWRFKTVDARVKLKRLYPTIAILERSEREH